MFMDPYAARVVHKVGASGEVFLVPYSPGEDRLYPVGVVALLQEAWMQPVFLRDPAENTPVRKVVALFARVVGQGRFRAATFWRQGYFLMAGKLEPVDVAALRANGYPVLDGAGWQPMGGQTLTKGAGDVQVTVQGFEFQGGQEVSLSGNVGGLISPERAHTVEHGLVRALNQYCFCTPRVLAAAVAQEGLELQMSLQMGFQLRRPEIFGMTQTGACGNPLSNLAYFYLAQELIERLQEGEPFGRSLEAARNLTLSRLVEDLELTDRAPFRVPRALKHGMFHDDTPLGMAVLKRVLARFPATPWG